MDACGEDVPPLRGWGVFCFFSQGSRPGLISVAPPALWSGEGKRENPHPERRKPFPHFALNKAKGLPWVFPNPGLKTK
jgi:hypothetical protein